ncbi:MAG: hypothetical protein ACK401_03755 [Archaeoglobaceae archaeon]
MRSSLATFAIALIILTLLPVESKTEVLIYLDKEKVSAGDNIRIAVSISFEKPSSIEILISGMGEVIWLCKNDSKVSRVSEGCGKSEWNVTIPESWRSGDYYVKVNIQDGSTLEFSKVFTVVRPRIIEAKVPELVYHGKKEAIVKAEVADPSKAKLHFRILGLNSRLNFQSDFDKDGVAKVEIDLRKAQSEPIKSGYYVAELKLFYDGKLFDSRSLTVEVVDPKLNISFSDEIKAGDPMRVEVSTNRNDDAGYSGIFLVLTGKNYREVKFVELEKDGKAKITFETAGLDEGYYTLYARDTSLTLKKVDLKTFSESYYALDPSNSNAKLFYAHDDVLVMKTLRIVKEKASRPTAFLTFEPFSKEINCKEIVELNVILLNLPKGISSYEVRFLVLNQTVAQIKDITTPSWAKDAYKAVFSESANIKAIDIENKVQSAEKLQIAKIKLLGIAEGQTEINADLIQLSDDEGNSMVAISRNAVVSVQCKVELEKVENATILAENFTNETRNEIEMSETKEKNESQNSQPILQNESKEVVPKESLNQFGWRGKLPKPKKIGVDNKDLFLAFTASLAFATTFLRRGLNSKFNREHGPR